MDAFSLVRFLPPVRLVDGSMIKTYPAGQAPVVMGKKKDSPEDVKMLLNTILPPREFEHEGEVWRQNVSTLCTDRYEGHMEALSVAKPFQTGC